MTWTVFEIDFVWIVMYLTKPPSAMSEHRLSDQMAVSQPDTDQREKTMDQMTTCLVQGVACIVTNPQ